MLKKYLVERTIPGIGSCTEAEFGEIAEKMNEAVEKLGHSIQWQESFVTANRLFCIYLADQEEIIHKHADLSGYPVDSITEVYRSLDPSDAIQADLPYLSGDPSENFII